ncbi:hypothetical protein ACVU7I_06125, partial [Patulibacter sp. S7RM1-6]
MAHEPPVDARRCLRHARADPAGRSAMAALLEAQFHHMGRDVTHPGGNVLAALGFVKQRAPAGVRRGVSRYVLAAGTPLVAVWPFALCVGDHRGAALLPRRSRALWWPLAGQPDCFTLRDLASLRAGCAPCPRPVLRRALLWLADYEERVDARVGTA